MSFLTCSDKEKELRIFPVRGVFAAFFSNALSNSPPTYSRPSCLYLCNRASARCPESWFGVITNKFGGDFFLLAYAVEAPSAISLRTKSPNKMLCVVFGITQKTIRPWFWMITILIYQRIKLYHGTPLVHVQNHGNRQIYRSISVLV